MEQKVIILDTEDSNTLHNLNSHLSNGWIVKHVSEQRVSVGTAIYVRGKIVYVLETTGK